MNALARAATEVTNTNKDVWCCSASAQCA